MILELSYLNMGLRYQNGSQPGLTPLSLSSGYRLGTTQEETGGDGQHPSLR